MNESGFRLAILIVFVLLAASVVFLAVEIVANQNRYAPFGTEGEVLDMRTGTVYRVIIDESLSRPGEEWDYGTRNYLRIVDYPNRTQRLHIFSRNEDEFLEEHKAWMSVRTKELREQILNKRWIDSVARSMRDSSR